MGAGKGIEIAMCLSLVFIGGVAVTFASVLFWRPASKVDLISLVSLGSNRWR